MYYNLNSKVTRPGHSDDPRLGPIKLGFHPPSLTFHLHSSSVVHRKHSTRRPISAPSVRNCICICVCTQMQIRERKRREKKINTCTGLSASAQTSTEQHGLTGNALSIPNPYSAGDSSSRNLRPGAPELRTQDFEHYRLKYSSSQ